MMMMMIKKMITSGSFTCIAFSLTKHAEFYQRRKKAFESLAHEGKNIET